MTTPVAPDRRDPDQDAALEKALIDGKLPEEDRRHEEPAAVEPGPGLYRDNATTPGNYGKEP